MAVTIDRCAEREIGDVVRFLDEYWERGHALVVNRRLLDWQYRNPDGSYSFIVARADGEVAGLLGYICTRRYDPALASDNVVWLTTWKVRDDAGFAGLGIAMLQRLSALEPHVAIGAVGFNVATRPIYRALAFTSGELQHYALPNAARRDLALASFVERPPSGPLPSAVTTHALTGAADFDRLGEIAAGAPRKTARYFHARYARHPLYTYRVLAIEDGGRTVGLLAARTLGSVAHALVQAADAEYADVYNAGIDPALFERAGFTRIDPDGADVVPDHFEPFEHRNVRLWFAMKGGGAPVLFKADGDQDRPNVVPREAP